MPTLTLRFEDRVLNEYSVGLILTIGRLPDNGVIIDNPAVSGHHACVFRDGDECIVEDLESTNGTFIDQKRVTRHTLKHGDVLQVGRHTLVFDKIRGDAADVRDHIQLTVPDLEGTVFLDTKQHKALLAKLDIQGDSKHIAGAGSALKLVARSQAPASVGVLRVLAGQADLAEYDLQAHTSLIGKDASSVVRLHGWFKPSVAVAITRQGENYLATLLRGRARINGQRQKGRYRLNEGDVLDVGGLTLEFGFKGLPSAGQTDSIRPEHDLAFGIHKGQAAAG